MKRALCIVAHPDDETIWMGGTISKNSSWDWTIFSLCRANDRDRAPKFKKVCKSYGAKALISDLEDEHLKPLKTSEISNKILQNLKTKSYDYIFTHGENGEYGHRRHKEIHKAVKSLVKSKSLECDKLFFFSYDTPNNSEIPMPTKKPDLTTSLSQSQLSVKKNTITSLYGFQANSFESLSCHKTEAFTSL